MNLVVSLLALAQETTKSGAMKQETTKAEKMSAKAVAVSGTVSADGKTFVDKDNKSWTVTNPTPHFAAYYVTARFSVGDNEVCSSRTGDRSPPIKSS
jgi:hypothetical protein